VYDDSMGLWVCCGVGPAGRTSCGNPTRERFDAPALNQLETYYTAGTNATSTSSSSSSSTLSTATTIVTASLTNSASAFASVPASSGRPTGAFIGPRVVGGVLALALIGALIFFLVKRRRRRSGLAGKALSDKHEPADLSRDTGRTLPPQLESDALTGPQVLRDKEPKELDALMEPQELPTDNTPRGTVPWATRDIPDLPEGLPILHPRT
jgi:hypothetical protein